MGAVRRFRPAAIVGALVALAACSAQSDVPSTSTVTVPSGVVNWFGGVGANPTLVDPDGSISMSAPGGSAQTSPLIPTFYYDANGNQLPQTRQFVGASVDHAGTLWLSSEQFGVPVRTDGQEHSQAAAMRALGSMAPDGRHVTVDPSTVAVVDSDSVLVGTFNPKNHSFWRADDVIVYRVAGGVSTAVAGRIGPADASPVADLDPGTDAAATSVSLGLVQAIASLGPSSFLILMTAPTGADDASDARLQAAVVENGSIRRLDLPDLCAGDKQVTAIPEDDSRVVVNAPKVDEDGGCRGPDTVWLEFDAKNGTSTPLGSGPGYAYLDGDRLVTATRTTPSNWSEWTITAIPRPSPG